MATVSVYQCGGDTYQAFKDGQYVSQHTPARWLEMLKDAAHREAFDLLPTLQAVVDAIDTEQGSQFRTGYARVEVQEWTPPDPASQHSGKTVRSSADDVYKVGNYVPVVSPGTAYYEIVDMYDNWESKIKAETLDGHLSAGNWKEVR